MIAASSQVVGSVQHLLGQIIDNDLFPEPNKPPRKTPSAPEKAELAKALEAAKHLTAVLERIVSVHPSQHPDRASSSVQQGQYAHGAMDGSSSPTNDPFQAKPKRVPDPAGVEPDPFEASGKKGQKIEPGDPFREHHRKTINADQVNPPLAQESRPAPSYPSSQGQQPQLNVIDDQMVAQVVGMGFDQEIVTAVFVRVKPQSAQQLTDAVLSMLQQRQQQQPPPPVTEYQQQQQQQPPPAYHPQMGTQAGNCPGVSQQQSSAAPPGNQADFSVDLGDLNFLLSDAGAGDPSNTSQNTASGSSPGEDPTAMIDESSSAKELKCFLDACGESDAYKGVLEKKELLRLALAAKTAGKYKGDQTRAPMEAAPNQVAAVAAQLGVDTVFVWDIYKTDPQSYQREDKLKDATVKKLQREGFAPPVNAGDMKLDCDEQTLIQWQNLANTGGVKAMLQYLDRVIWTNSGWTPLLPSDLCLVDQVKVAYKKALRVVHPDKLPGSVPPEIKAYATRVFDPLKMAYDSFMENERMVQAHLEQQNKLNNKDE